MYTANASLRGRRRATPAPQSLGWQQSARHGRTTVLVGVLAFADLRAAHRMLHVRRLAGSGLGSPERGDQCVSVTSSAWKQIPTGELVV
jgi:hypothetical protein